MTSYDMYGRPLASVTMGELSVTITQRSGTITAANIIHAERDGDGRVSYALLDRKVHSDHARYEGWTLGGCYVTEMHRERPPAEQVSDVAGLVRDQVDDVLERAWPDAPATYGAACDIARHIEAQDRLVDFWRRDAMLDELCGWIVRCLDDAELDVDIDRLEAVARQIVGLCKAVMG